MAKHHDLAVQASKSTKTFGLLLNVNGKRFALYPKDAHKTGVIDVSLPAGMKVMLGTIEDDFDELMRLVGADLKAADVKETANKLPVVGSLLTKFMEAVLAIEQLHLKYDGSKTPKLKYAITISLSFPGGIGATGLSLDGITLDYSNMEDEPPPGPT